MVAGAGRLDNEVLRPGHHAKDACVNLPPRHVGHEIEVVAEHRHNEVALAFR